MAVNNGGVTDVSVAYLRQLNASFADILQQVNDQLNGKTTATATAPAALIEPVNADLQVKAGSPGAGGPDFDAAAALNAAMSDMGGSVHDQLDWLRRVLSTMIGEVNDAIAAVGTVNHLNDEQADALVSDFEHTIGVHHMPAPR